MNATRRLLPSALVLGLVVAVSASTGAVAAKLVTSADIADGTIRVVDLNPAAVDHLQGQRGATGATGARGPAGPHGQIGPPGYSVAQGFAHVFANGSLDTASATRIQSISSAAGGYCLKYDGNSSPTIVLVSIDVSVDDSRKDLVSATADPSAVSGACGAASGANILVYTADSYLTDNVPRAFYIAVIA